MKRLEIIIESRHCALVKGYGSRDLLTELRGRPPVWATLSRAWVTTEQIARDLVAVAESRGYDVLVSPRPTPSTSRCQRDVDLDVVGTEAPDPGRGLW